MHAGMVTSFRLLTRPTRKRASGLGVYSLVPRPNFTQLLHDLTATPRTRSGRTIHPQLRNVIGLGTRLSRLVTWQWHGCQPAKIQNLEFAVRKLRAHILFSLPQLTSHYPDTDEGKTHRYLRDRVALALINLTFY